MTNGTFIVLEGIDGAGTTTLARLLAESLSSQGHETLVTHEPTDGPIGLLIRGVLTGATDYKPDWITLALLFAADRLDHVETTIRPALDRGCIVISDRYDLSSLVYQSALGQDDAVPWIQSLNSKAVRPDLTVILEVHPEVAASRRRLRGGPADLFEVDCLQEALAKMYSAADYLVPNDCLAFIDGNGSKENTLRSILKVVRTIRLP